MIETLTFRDQVESVRPPGAAKRETKALFLTALRFETGSTIVSKTSKRTRFFSMKTNSTSWPSALTELAEDLHADAGLWRSLEAYHRDFFGVSLPLLCSPVNPRWNIRRPPFSVFSLQCVATFSTGSHRFPGASRVSGHRPFRQQVFLPGFRRTAAAGPRWRTSWSSPTGGAGR